MDRHRPGARVVVLACLIALGAVACRTTGQKPDYVQPTPASSPSPAPSGPSTSTSAAFMAPFTITQPAGWLVGYTHPDIENIYLPMGPDEGPRVGIDVEEVSRVIKDPCAHGEDYIDIGP